MFESNFHGNILTIAVAVANDDSCSLMDGTLTEFLFWINCWAALKKYSFISWEQTSGGREESCLNTFKL